MNCGWIVLITVFLTIIFIIGLEVLFAYVFFKKVVGIFGNGRCKTCDGGDYNEVNNRNFKDRVVDDVQTQLNKFI